MVQDSLSGPLRSSVCTSQWGGRKVNAVTRSPFWWPLVSHGRTLALLLLLFLPARQAPGPSVLVKWPENAIIGYRCAVMNCRRYPYRRLLPVEGGKAGWSRSRKVTIVSHVRFGWDSFMNVSERSENKFLQSKLSFLTVLLRTSEKS